jgi:hypothetical protein
MASVVINGDLLSFGSNGARSFLAADFNARGPADVVDAGVP